MRNWRTFIGDSAKESNAGFICLETPVKDVYQINAMGYYILAVMAVAQNRSERCAEVVRRA